jgi:DNA-binding PadR family transcriptional regulator
MSSPVTTTGYALLGLLALRPWTAYELAAEAQHCFEYFWPRADARVYEEVKGLAKAGLAVASRERIGRRPRTTYAITPAGRAALEVWLARPPEMIALEFEALLKVYLARFGTREDLLANLERTRDDAAFMLRVARTVRQAYLEGCAPLQDEYVHVWAFVYDFLVDYFTLIHRWAERTRATVEGWADLSPEDKRERALQVFDEKRPPLPPGTETPDAAIPAQPGQWLRRRRGRAERHREPMR